MKKSKTAMKIIFALVVAAAMTGLLVAVSRGHAVPVLQTHGIIADKERDLIYITLGLGAIVVVPVLMMLFVIAWRYRASNTKAVYQPDYATNSKIEAVWWGIPCLIILALAIITAYATHDLDPYKEIASPNKPINVEVVALQWRWLFIYPDQKIATIDYLNIPEQTPVNFTITSDAPMNSFWIPALAGQVYAMSGMSTQLHIMSDGVGTYDGSSANLSGSGFASMTFKVNSMTSDNFKNWVTTSTKGNTMLTAGKYATIAEPTTSKSQTTLKLMDSTLYNDIIMKTTGSSSMSGMSM